MKILYVAHTLSMSGANRSLYQLIKELKNEYLIDAVVLAPESDKKNGTIHMALKEIGVPVVETPIWYFKLENPTFRNVLGYARYLWRCRHLFNMLQEYHFDLVHSNTSVVDLGAYISRKLKIKHVWHFREFGDLDYNLHPIGGKIYERYTYRHADAYIAISEVIANYFRNRISADKLYTIYNGIYVPKDIPLSSHNYTGVHFFCAGLISEVKNQKEIIYALDELINVRKIKTPCHVTLVGIQTQPYTDELKTLINERRLDKYVSVLPETNGIQSLAASMDVGIMCSKSEAFGRVTIEYQLQNLLVIANDAGANMELIQDGITGLIYERTNYHDLADKMQWVMEHLDDMKKLAQKGRENALKKFTSKRNTREIYNLYNKLFGVK